MKITEINFTNPIFDIIRKRLSCRTYADRAIDSIARDHLTALLQELSCGPFNTRSRFKLVAASEGDTQTLRGLGTYGFIHNAPGFIMGAVQPGERNLEDFGYLMEAIILFATDLGLGTCWLGGTFTRSSFAARIDPTEEEVIPAVTAVGYPAKEPRKLDARIRKTADSDNRLPWDALFFEADGKTSLTQTAAGSYRGALEMVRLGPSASNKQPWRIARLDGQLDFYLQRTPGYLDNPYTKLLKIEDLQRVDMGIAMCHFELGAAASGIEGHWRISPTPAAGPAPVGEYLVSWVFDSVP
jgi:nitroreductase